MQQKRNNSSSWLQFCLVFIVSIILIVTDTKTNLLNGARGTLSVALSPVQKLAAIPFSIGSIVNEALSPEPDIELAYKTLHNEYFQLKSETLLLDSLKEENATLRSLLGASKRLDEKITLGSLVNVSTDPYSHRLLVDRGMRHGVYAGQAVVDDKGVIGQVTEVMPFNSSVMLITDPGHAMPVQAQRTGLRTIVYGTGDTNVLKIPFLNQNSNIKVDDVLYSTGLGGRFISGYPVAIVDSVEVIQDEAFIRVTARPIAKLDRTNHVLLLSRSEVIDSDANELSSRIQDNESGSKKAH